MAGCVRQAWLELNGQTIQLEDRAGGWFCTSLDLGFPTVRAVANDRPGADGSIDRTQFMGSRGVTANVTALEGAGAQVDDVAASFAPYMVASVRPLLHYVLDRPGAPERVLGPLRAAGYTWAVQGPYQRDIQLQWVAADPAAKDPTVRVAIAWTGSSTVAGRTYDLAPDRIYPAGGTAPVAGVVRSLGDLPVTPALRIYGPIENPVVSFRPGAGPVESIVFFDGLIVDSGDWLDIDTLNKTALYNSDPARSVITSIDWINTVWPVLDPDPQWYSMTLQGSTTSSLTQATATWQDRYLT
jgi:hypothetical protein